MGASLWDEVLPLLIGIDIDIVVAALCFLSIRLWNCLMKLIKTLGLTASRSDASFLKSFFLSNMLGRIPTILAYCSVFSSKGFSPVDWKVGESAHDQPLHDSEAAAHNGVPDLEMGNGNGPAQGVDSVTASELELANRGGGIEHISDQETRTPVMKSPVTTPKAQVTPDAARGALVPVEMNVPHSQQEEGNSW